MKTRMIHLAALVVLILMIPAVLQAQMPIRQPLFRVSVPFAFVAGGVHLPAGDYSVYHPGDPYLVVIEKDDGRARAMAYVHPSATKSDEASTKLVFNKYGDQYFLSQVWTEPDQEVHHCFRCQAEQALLAQAGKRELVVVAAKR
ncbi:MAG: hypothetical protein LAO23_22280 [Acidobacteriia bacterium]|nr:hypothetical protein [Terriglobia bacterium]